MSVGRNSKYGAPWQRDELILALYLYCQIPFQQTKANNPEVIRLAHLLGRTPSSVARKLGNFGAFDPLLAQKGISGLTHFSKADKAVWDRFSGKWADLVSVSRRLLATKSAERVPSMENPPVISIPTGPTDRSRTVLTRLYQSFFRRAVLSSYQNVCCICEIDLVQLLTASHIVPWSIGHEMRTNPQNGLCLCALHDRAFDRGLISVTSDFHVAVSSLVKQSRTEFAARVLWSFRNRIIKMPSRFPPEPQYLQWHVDNVFQD